MTAPIRALDTGLMPARWNVAMTAALAERHAGGLTPDTIRLHRYPASVLLGCNQEAQRAVDLDYCRGHSIEVARRVTGGGCVFMSPGMLAWEVVVERQAASLGLDALTRHLCQGVADGLQRLGVAAHFRAPNDVEVAGRKISGSSGLMVGRSALLQGTVLLADDVATMARALRTPEAALRAQVTWLGAALDSAPAAGSVADAVLRGLAAALGRAPAPACVTPEELARADDLLREEIGTETFVTGDAARREAAS